MAGLIALRRLSVTALLPVPWDHLPLGGDGGDAHLPAATLWLVPWNALLPLGVDFARPAGTRPNAIVFGSGVVRLPAMMRTWVLSDLLAAGVFTVYGATWVQRVLP
ncbi:hypothetical protein LZ198_38955 [Myxococcus sp. K15C18031901]|uniref:hypothetical protein n=1 Tax=Myxococcus dinghuensis TaxID=2906761 RepID=UPI0020A77425|nr:hypothetical protein [Myxococcus dinghuensis]MCP3104863.1 hypothetical protein [Myxococcus dinghuensis]